MDNTGQKELNSKRIITLKHHIAKIPFKISTSSMVFEEGLLENVRYLADLFDHIEIVLFHTPELNNLPTGQELEELTEMAEQKKISYSVHLPASLEIAAEDEKRREESIRSAFDIITLMLECRPRNYILHIPLTTPTLAFIPGGYVYEADQDKFMDWTLRAMASLQSLQQMTGLGDGILVENINYSPSFLEPLWSSNLCQLCLDLGHLMLGGESILDRLKKYTQVTQEIHLHGVKDNHEHQALSVVPMHRVKRWLNYLDSIQYSGVINFEVFTPDDLEASVSILCDAFN